MNFLVDVNLPKFFRFFNKPNFSFVADIDIRLSDSEIWQYALENECVILTKDTDFYYKSLSSENKPKIIFFSLGNNTLAQLNTYFETHWDKIQELIKENYLIVAKPNQIDIIL